MKDIIDGQINAKIRLVFRHMGGERRNPRLRRLSDQGSDQMISVDVVARLTML
jgi:hypothetical protein